MKIIESWNNICYNFIYYVQHSIPLSLSNKNILQSKQDGDLNDDEEEDFF